MLELTEMHDIIKNGGSIRTDAGEVVTDLGRLEDALAEAAAMPAPKKAIYPSLDNLVEAQTVAEMLKGQLANAKVALAEDDALITALTADKATLVEANQKLTNDNATRITDNVDLAGKNTTLTTQNAALEADKTALTADKEALTADKVALEADKKDLQTQVADLQKQLTAATKKAAAATPDGPLAAS